MSKLLMVGLGIVGLPLVGFVAVKLFGLGASASGGPPAGPPRSPPQA
jgi:hypothetical protein